MSGNGFVGCAADQRSAARAIESAVIRPVTVLADLIPIDLTALWRVGFQSHSRLSCQCIGRPNSAAAASCCDTPGYWCEVHHVEEWAATHWTDINILALVCGSDHSLVEPGGWTTRKRANGDTEWISPAHLGYGQPRTNTFHHPEKLLCDDGDDEDHP